MSTRQFYHSSGAENENRKKNEMINKYLNLAGEQKKLSNIKMTMIPIVVVVLEKAPKGLERRLAE